MNRRTPKLAININDDSRNRHEVAEDISNALPCGKLIPKRTRITAMVLGESMLIGIAGTLMLGCLIFWFGPETWLAKVYLLPATYSGPVIENMLLHSDHTSFRGDLHQISVILSVMFCLVFWSVAFGAAFYWLESQAAIHERRRVKKREYAWNTDA